MINCLDRSIPLKERVKVHKKDMDKLMNPFPNFDPNDFEPLAATKAEKDICYRKRKNPKKELPTFGLYPREIRVGQMIGLYENNQDIYLTFAHRCNELQKEVDELKKIVKGLEDNS